MAWRNLSKIFQDRVSVKAPVLETLTTNGTVNNDSSSSNTNGSFSNDDDGNNVNNNNDINNDYNNILKKL